MGREPGSVVVVNTPDQADIQTRYQQTLARQRDALRGFDILNKNKIVAGIIQRVMSLCRLPAFARRYLFIAIRADSHGHHSHAKTISRKSSARAFQSVGTESVVMTRSPATERRCDRDAKHCLSSPFSGMACDRKIPG